RARAPVRAAARGRPGGGTAHPAEQRPADRAGAGGDRADRSPVPRRIARTAALLRRGVPRRGPRHRGAGRPDRPAGRRHVGGRPGRRGPRARGGGPAPRTHRQPGVGLPAGAAVPGRRVDRGAGARRDRTRHASFRAAAAVVVPARPADPLAGRGPPGPGPGSAGRRAVTGRRGDGQAVTGRCGDGRRDDRRRDDGDIRSAKSHGTANAFVILPDPDVRLPLTAEFVAALCDRRHGIGGYGVLRVVRRDGGWFMDYWNADGSLAEMCGNGARVYARYLVAAAL